MQRPLALLCGALLLAAVSLQIGAGDSAADEAWTADGFSSYSGQWTLTQYESDREIFMPEHEVGDTAPGSVTVECEPGGDSCAVEMVRDGDNVFSGGMSRGTDGALAASPETIASGCPGGGLEIRRVASIGAAAASATEQRDHEPQSCEENGTTAYLIDETWTFAGELTEHVPASDPEVVAPPANPPSVGSGVDQPGEPFANSIPTVSEISTDPTVILQSALLALLLVFLMPFPGQLFNSTLEAHEDEVRGWLRLDRGGARARRVAAFWASWPGIALFTLAAALLYCLLDPTFGMQATSLATFAGMLTGIVLVTVAFAVPAMIAHGRVGDGFNVKVVPLSLLAAVACVLISRLTGFQPGYIYGLLIGLAFSRELSAADDGRVTAAGGALMLAVAFFAWLALGAVPDANDVMSVSLRTALAALMVAGLEGATFGLLPMRFLPGEPLYRWNRLVWGSLLLVGAFGFFHILINPASGYLADSSRTPLLTVLALLVGFALISVAFWAWFRYRAPATPEPMQAAND